MLPAALIAVLLAVPSPVLAEFPTVPESDAASVWVDALADCESNGSTTVKVLDVNGRYSYGKYQWQMRSWLSHKDLGATKDNIFDEAMQDKITRAVLDDGGWRNWYNCSNAISKKLGPYPKKTTSD